jgi:oligopeptide/dipeptide ABC transporter ATP-binding protein
MTPLLDIKDLATVFDTERGRIRAVDGVSLNVAAGETLGIVGESGCGKTMLSLSVMRLLPANGRIISGEILFDGTDLLKLSEEEMRARRGADLAMVFQEPMTSLNPVFRVGDQIAEAIRLHRNVSTKQAWDMSVELLREVGISDPQKRARDYPHNLSGGMRQRVMIAMAVSCRPRLLLADEPTTALDVTIQAQILELMEELKRKNKMTVILITHDLGVVAQSAQKVAVVYAGKIVESASVENLFDRPLHPYTQGLLESIPAACAQGPDPKRRLKTIPGSVPDLYHIPPGCRFSDRCAYGFERCLREEPALTEILPGHQAACWKALEGGR